MNTANKSNLRRYELCASSINLKGLSQLERRLLQINHRSPYDTHEELQYETILLKLFEVSERLTGELDASVRPCIDWEYTNRALTIPKPKVESRTPTSSMPKDVVKFTPGMCVGTTLSIAMVVAEI
jgi:hypothetical protein